MKLRARPWTAVADDGIVSALISSFFAWDGYYFLPFVDQECFIRDMNTGDIKRSKFCSPFLVNAVCTIQVSLFPYISYSLETMCYPEAYGWIVTILHIHMMPGQS
jgi:hypothetical protein